MNILEEKKQQAAPPQDVFASWVIPDQMAVQCGSEAMTYV